MARMVPDISPANIENAGERAFFEAACQLPDDYTVFHSLTYQTVGDDEMSGRIGEADFIVVHPELGYLVFEVKQGRIGYRDGGFHASYIDARRARRYTEQLPKNPIEQATRAMYAIRDHFTRHTGERFPLAMDFALCFPETLRLEGTLPLELGAARVLVGSDLPKLQERILTLLNRKQTPRPTAMKQLLELLAPQFEAAASLGDEVQLFRREAQHVLTDEQQRILDETELDKRKVFFGAAGTGKTWIAVEKARRLAQAGRRVLLTCYNRSLAQHLRTQVPRQVVCASFHDYLLERLAAVHQQPAVPPDTSSEAAEFYDRLLPNLAQRHLAERQSERFDSIIVDEGQDFREGWVTCLEGLLADPADGEFFIFADPNQNLFGVDLSYLWRLNTSRQRLTRNLRNAEAISKWAAAFLRERGPQPVLTAYDDSAAVVAIGWNDAADERLQVEASLNWLVHKQAVSPSSILILSPNKIEHSSLAGCERIGEWPLNVHPRTGTSGVRFATIRALKGLEADIVFLIGLEADRPHLTDADIYVGGTRARFLLYLFHSKKRPPVCLTHILTQE